MLSIGEIQCLELRTKLVPKADDFEPKKTKEDAQEQEWDSRIGNPGIGYAEKHHDKKTEWTNDACRGTPDVWNTGASHWIAIDSHQHNEQDLPPVP